jgi:hypothetical protein
MYALPPHSGEYKQYYGMYVVLANKVTSRSALLDVESHYFLITGSCSEKIENVLLVGWLLRWLARKANRHKRLLLTVRAQFKQ